jgi:cobalt-zinc-cadmium resistance protein CzcA
MFDRIIAYSVKNKFVIGLMVSVLVFWGIYSLRQLPIDAVPDITNNQVMVITNSPNLATLEVERFITTPIELSLQNLQRIEEIRSISRFGLSVVTVVFEEGYDVYLARQLVTEHLKSAEDNIPEGLGTPELAPISTGLGEIYQYVVRPIEGYEDQYSATELRSIQDWIVRRQLSGIEGVVEINSIGGFLKQYEVAIDPVRLKSMNISIQDVFDALEKSNQNTGGAYIEKNHNTYYIRSEGLVNSLEDIGNIVIFHKDNVPVLIKDVAKVKIGKAPRYGALVMNGEEVVGGKAMMFKGANSAQVTEQIKERVLQIQKSLPEGLVIEPYLVRDKLVSTAIGTVQKNLLEGGLIVIFILVLMLGNWRAGLIVTSVIPLAMLFAISMMNLLGISANLMSLGAIDFGLIVDGAVIIVESIVHRLQGKYAGQRLTANQLDSEVITSSQKIRNSAAFGEIIILMVYIPILALVGIEGKMFKPMAETVMLAIGGALILSLTYVPMMSALFLNKNISKKQTIADKIIAFLQKLYQPMLDTAMRFKKSFVMVAIAIFAISLFVFSRMGGEFIPTLEEGDLAMQHILPPGSSLSQSVEVAKKIQRKMLDEFPEIEDVVVNIGSAEIPTDPMPVEIGDYAMIMKPKSEWTSASSRIEMFEKLEASLQDIPGIDLEFSQPIQLRFNELMTGTKADIAVKLYGQDLITLYEKAKETKNAISSIEGVGTVNVEQTVGMPQIIVDYDYKKLAQYGLQIKDVNTVIRSAFAGEKAGVIYEGDNRFDLVVRIDERFRTGIEDVKGLFISTSNGSQIPLSNVAKVELKDAPMQISRENTNRRIVIGVNVGNTDVESLVEKIQTKLDKEIELPTGYYFTYGGQFENLKAANARLAVAIPIALALIFVLLFFTFTSFTQAALIFMAIPFSAIGGIWALQLRDMPFSISAGIGFIALFGVAVLNGIVLIGYFNELKKDGVMDLKERILRGTRVRLRPVLMTAAVASLGFLPMALSTSGGAEVQRPLATVVIGGLITATLLTLLILPILYSWLETWNSKRVKLTKKGTVLLILIFGLSAAENAMGQIPITLRDAIDMAMDNNPELQVNELIVQKYQKLSKLVYTPGPTNFFYNGEGLYRQNGQRLNEIGFVQNLNHPAGYKAFNSLNQHKSRMGEIDAEISRGQIKYSVQETYLTIQYKKSLYDLYNGLIQYYADYADKADVRVKSGAANIIELLNITSKLEEYRMLAIQLENDINNFEVQLQLLSGSEDQVTSTDTLKPYDFVLSENSNNLWYDRSVLNTEMERSQVLALKSTAKPQFNFGYSAQNFYEVGWFSGAQAGITLPLFKKNVKRKIEAQQVEVMRSKLESQKTILEYERNKSSIENKIKNHAEGMNFYQLQLDEVVPQLNRISQLNYSEGELNYLELLNAINTVTHIEISYLSQVYEYNKAIANYQFLLNQ